MSKIQTLNNKILVSNGAVLVYPESSGGNAQASKSYTVAASGAQTISPDTGYDSMQEVALSVPAGSAGTPSATKGTVSNHAVSVTPSVTNTTGWITGETKNGTAVSISASELVSGTYNVTSSGTKDVTNYASASVPGGTATAPASISGTSASVSTGTNTLTLSKTVSVTPNISTAGYISSGTAGNSSVSLTASVTTKAAATITPTTSNQTIASGTYLTGTQTIAGDANLVAGNIKKDVSIFNVTGTYEGSGGGATNFVTGTFITGSSTSTVGSLSITYSGSGYPIMLAIWVEGGCYNSSGASDWYNSLTRYAVGQVIITKGVTTSTPTYTTSGSANYGTIQLLYKNSTSQATLYSSTRSASANSYSSSNANGTSFTCVRWKGNKSLSYYVSGGTSSTYGLLASTTYRYVVYYSA